MGVLVLKSAPQADEPVDEFAATVVLDERTAKSGKTAAAGETSTGGKVQDIDAALDRNARR